MSVVTQLARLIDTADSRVAEFELPAGFAGPWHHHSRMVEHCYCLGAELAIDFSAADTVNLRSGQRCEIPARVNHRIRNGSAEACRYLVVQHGGAYDFLENEKEK